MIGLFVKDCYLLFQRKQTLVIFLVVGLLMGVSNGGSFMVGYLSFLGALLALSTISYDDADNGLMFLMTLPVERKTYADSKYLLGVVICGVSWCAAVILLFVVALLKGQALNVVESLGTSLVFLPFSVLVLDLMIPMQLKFGAEKSRIVMIAAFGAVTAIGIIIGRNTALELDTLMAVLDRIPAAMFILAAAVLFAAVTLISVAVSRKIVEKKVF